MSSAAKAKPVVLPVGVTDAGGCEGDGNAGNGDAGARVGDGKAVGRAEVRRNLAMIGRRIAAGIPPRSDAPIPET